MSDATTALGVFPSIYHLKLALHQTLKRKIVPDHLNYKFYNKTRIEHLEQL